MCAQGWLGSGLAAGAFSLVFNVALWILTSVRKVCCTQHHVSEGANFGGRFYVGITVRYSSWAPLIRIQPCWHFEFTRSAY